MALRQLSSNTCYEGNINNQNSKKSTDTFQKCLRSAILWKISMVLNQVLPKNSNKCNGSKLNVVNEQTVIAQSWYFAQNKQKWFFDVTNLNGIPSHS